MDETFEWIEGAIGVEAVLRAGSREMTAIYIREDRYDGAAARIRRLAEEAGLVASRVPANELLELDPQAGRGSIIARVGPRRTRSLDELMLAPAPVLVLLDGVEDPYNFGQAIRSLYAAGIDGLVMPPRRRFPAATVIRASAGASEFMPSATAEAGEAIAVARERGIPIAVAAASGSRAMDEVDLTGPLLLLIGGEKRGVSRSVEQAADLLIRIPYGREVNYALGTAAAATTLGFEVLRQRRARVAR